MTREMSIDMLQYADRTDMAYDNAVYTMEMMFPKLVSETVYASINHDMGKKHRRYRIISMMTATNAKKEIDEYVKLIGTWI